MNPYPRLFLVSLILPTLLFLPVSNALGAEYYWVGGTGDWSDINHWATTSGGSVTHFTVPTPGDNVHFDANSFSGPGQMVTLNLNIITCRDFDAVNAPYQPAFISASTTRIEIYGSLLLRPDLIMLWNSELHFLAASPGHLVRTAGHPIPGNVLFSGPGGGWTLADTLDAFGKQIHLAEGSLNTAGQTVICEQFNTNYAFTRTLNLSNSHLYVTSSWNSSTIGLTLYAGTSHIILTSPGSSFQGSGPGSLTYYNLYFPSTTGFASLSPGTAVFNRVEFNCDGGLGGNVTYGDLVLGYSQYYYFVAYSTHTFLDSLVAVGHCLSPLVMQCNLGTTNFVKSSGTLEAHYAEMKGITATGGASFQAIACYDLGNNSGWLFSPPAPRTLFWVGGQGEWGDTARWSASSGGAGGQCPPTSVDHVIFDNNSFSSANDTVQGIPLHMYCNDMTWTATAFAPCFFSNATNQLHVYGSLTLQPDMHWAMLGTVLFEATSTGHTVDPAGNAFYGMVDFKGNGGGWTLLDSLIIIDQNLQHIRGHLNTAGHKVDCYRYYSHDPNIRELTLGATRMILRADIIEAFHLNASFFTLNAGTSEIVLAGRSPTFFAQNATSLDFYDLTFSCDSGRATFEKPGTAFHTVRFHSHGTVIGNTEMDSLVLSKGRNYTFQALTGQLIGTLVAPGTCIEPILIESDSIGALTTFSMGPDTSTVYDVQVTDISCVPDSLIRGFNSLDLGKTTGWAMQRRIGTDYYWIGGTGRWDDTLHWSNVSGGLPAGCLPSPVDDVFFDNNSFLSPKDTVDAGGRLIQCRDVSWIHSNSQPFFTGEDSATWRIYGSMLLSDSMQYNYRGVISFLADTTGKTLTTRGRVLLNTLLFQHPQGGWTLMDSLFMKCEDCALDLRQGRLVTRNRYLELPGLRSTRNLTRALDMRASVCHIGLLGWTMCTDSLSLWADSSHIIFDTSGVMLNFDGDTVIYHNLSFTSQNAFPLLITEQCIAVFNEVRFLSSASIAGENIYDTLYFSSGKNYYIEEDQTQHFQHLDAAGDCFNYIRILCIDNNKQTAFSKTSDTLRLDFVRLRGIKAGGGAVFEALNSLDDGDNLNWTIINPPSTDHYWVGGSGNWSDSSHWSYSSGGPGGACIPTRRDDVYFDASSFLPGQDTVTIDLLAECRSMDWSGAKGNPLLMGTWSLSLFGSLNLTDSMLNMLNAYWYFASDAPGNTIHTASQPFLRPVFFQGNGSWDLTDDFHCYAEIYHAKGRLNTQGHFVSASAYRSDFENPRVLDLGSSTLQLNSAQMISWVVDGTNMSILPGTSTIIFSQATGMENKTGSNLEYHNVVFANSSGSSLIRSNQIECRFNHVILHNGARIFGKNTFDSLTFFPDHTYQLDASLPQTIGEYWWIRGNNCFPVRLESTTYGDQAEVIKDTGVITGDFIHMRDILASGGASFYAGVNSSDIKNNSGWVFNNAPSYVYGFPEDTFLIKGTPLVLNTLNFNGGPGTTYLWGDGSTGSTLTVSTPGVYYVSVSYDSNCMVSDSIQVYCRLGLDFTPTPTTCNAYSDGAVDLSVQGDPGQYAFQWSTGDTTEDVNSLSAGWYTVTVTDSICWGIDSVEVIEPPVPDAQLSDTAFCEDTTLTIVAKPGFMEYAWSTGATTPWVTLDQGDSIWLVVTDSNGCVSIRFNAFVREDPLPQPGLGTDTCITYDGSLRLDPGSFESYLWQDGSTAPVLNVEWQGMYWVQVKSATCFASDTLSIASCPPEIHLGNVFTPNGDGINDVFLPETRNVVLFRMLIFNRWGGLVFQTDDTRLGWDGRCEGRDCPEGTYFYTVDYSFFLEEDLNHTRQGSVTLLR